MTEGANGGILSIKSRKDKKRMKRKIGFSTTRLIMLSFLVAIFVGSLLLWLPISSADEVSVSYIDALFTATTATCVTGLVTLPTVSTWSVFGQIIILLLIQIGGLGIITVMAGITAALHKKMGLSDRLLIQDAFNLNSLSGLSEFIKKVIIGTFAVEGVGALCYMTVFVPKFGFRGIWISVFNSVSAFCNAGIDIISENSLCEYTLNPVINLVTSLLIILGGLGYIVWWDIARVLTSKNIKKRKAFRHLTLHSKIVLSSTALFIIVGGVLIFAFEYNNPLTIGNMNLFEKLEVSLFQSITTRTAGFASVPQQNLTNGSALTSMLLMFIGGSPVGTAGGVKTVTAVVLIASAISAIKNKNEVSLFGRTIPKAAVSKAIGVVGMSFATVFVSTLLMTAVTDTSFLDILYETVSATATVGLSRNLTGSINELGKLIIIITMYLGRVGPISLAVAFTLKKQSVNLIKGPIENISVG